MMDKGASGKPDPLVEVLEGIKWKSVDRDNMEFTATITTWQHSKLRDALAKGERAVEDRAASVPNAICGYPLPGWRLDSVEWSEITGQPDGWIVSLKREGPDWTSQLAFVVMARSDIGPLEAWDEALRIALREDERAAARSSNPSTPQTPTGDNV